MTRPASSSRRPPARPSLPTAPPQPGVGAVPAPSEPPTHLIVGRVLAPWGYRGEVRAEILTDFPERFSSLKEIHVGPERVAFPVESARLHRGNVILKLAGIDDPEQAAALRGELLYVPLSAAVPLPEHHYYHHQIIGLEVWTTSGHFLGHVTEILETGSNDVYVVEQKGNEMLIPALAHVIEQVDLEHHRLVVTLPPGLLDEDEA